MILCQASALITVGGGYMAAFDYSGVVPEVREDLSEAYGKVWSMLAQPGNWWRAEDRIAIAQESRNARSCELCRTRKSALSPYGGEGVHDASTNLPVAAIDAVHRITTDPARIKKAWIDDLGESGISHGHYVELLGIVVAVISIDGFHRAMGLSLAPLPQPVAGEPDHYLPTGARDHGAFVATILPQDLTTGEADLYGGSSQTGNVITAMSLVPDSVRMLTVLGGAQYLPASKVADPTDNGGRALNRAQIELTAARVSSLSDCFY